MVDFKQILSVSLILFSVIDILGSIPIIINLRKKVGHIQSEKATLAAGVLMIAFLLVGKSILSLFGIGVEDFAIAGALIIFNPPLVPRDLGNPTQRADLRAIRDGCFLLPESRRRAVLRP